MKKLNLKIEGIGEMLTKDQMRRILGGGYGGGYGGDNCAGQKFFCTTAEGCGYAWGIMDIGAGCMLSECRIEMLQPCAYA